MTDLSRRALVAGLALSPVLATILRPLPASAAPGAGPAACALTPGIAEDGSYTDVRLVREDITEGRAGLPLTLLLRLVTPQCLPVSGARVDVWHCDATGAYSGPPAPGGTAGAPTTFLRGTGFTDAQGGVRFRTIYPGWVRGRTPHVHYKVFLGGQPALTSQIFFPDAVNEAVFAGQQPYASRAGTRDTFNTDDRVLARLDTGAMAELEHGAGGITAWLQVGLDAPAAAGPLPSPPPPGRRG
ncbi:protocatechuate dioxygenase [Paroceanicella profunda]|uniref:Protocatechuate dioxygenase n=1 Tax=Paroceanicella profunda TaxID=2579971 RepID=A0A5B8FX51_9RHOB|nr:protocatechuate dioxygenase [Paroceanicella profunda]QDL91770.1 protocatechuate dioxygenase [Paroceanicella profunda]